MRRRDALVALLALGAPMGSFAQQQAGLRLIGFLGPGSRSTTASPDDNVDAFVKGMRDLGYVEGKNLVIDWKFADGDYQRLAGLAAELVRGKPELIVVYGTAGAQALQRETKTIPIVIAAALDPIGSGFATSLARPGGNITGLSALAVDLSQKHLELLTDMMPKLSRAAVLVNPRNAGHRALLIGVESAAKPLNIKIIAADAGTPDEIEIACAAARRNGAGAVIIAADAFFAGAARQIADASIRNRLPSIGIYGAHVSAGTLMAYGQNIAELHWRAANYVDKILKGAKPGDLPIEQPTKFELVINLKTARTLGIKVPETVLLRADQVIE